MSKIKQAIERKFPRYFVANGKGVDEYDVWTEGSHLCRGLSQPRAVCDMVVKERNELIDMLVEASELLAEAAPQAVETTPKAHKRWRP